MLNIINSNHVEVVIQGRDEPFNIYTDDGTAIDIATSMYMATDLEPTLEIVLPEYDAA